MDLIELLESHNLGLLSRKVFRQLGLGDLRSCSQVNKLWNSIIQDNFPNIIKECPEETDSKWLHGTLKVTKLDLSSHLDHQEFKYDKVNTICRSGYTFFFPPKAKTGAEQLMIVYCGSNFVNKVTVPNCGLTRVFENDSDFIDFWDWEYLEVYDHEPDSFVLIAQSAADNMKEYKYYRNGGKKKQYHAPDRVSSWRVWCYAKRDISLSFTVECPWRDEYYKGCNSREWLCLDQEKKGFLFWKLIIEKREFEVARQFQLPTAQISTLKREIRGDLDKVLMMTNNSHGPYHGQVIMETDESIRVFKSIICSSAELVAVISPKPRAPFNYTLGQSALMSANIEEDVANKKLNLVINIHDLGAKDSKTELTSKIFPTVARVGSCAIYLDVKESLEDRFNLVVVTLLDDERGGGGDVDVVQEHFYFVIDVVNKKVYSKGWSKWGDAIGQHSGAKRHFWYRHFTKFQFLSPRLVFQKGQGLRILKENENDDDKLNIVDPHAKGKPGRALEWDVAKAVCVEGTYTLELNRLNHGGVMTNSRCDYFVVQVETEEKDGKSNYEYYTVEFG